MEFQFSFRQTLRLAYAPLLLFQNN